MDASYTFSFTAAMKERKNESHGGAIRTICQLDPNSESQLTKYESN
jgi:hypothetical protein